MVKDFTTNMLGENCYVFSHNGEAAIIDCGAYSERHWLPIKKYIEAEGLTLRYCLLTHTHFDHIYGLTFVHRDFGLLPQCHQLDAALYASADATCMSLMGEPFPNPQPALGSFLFDGQKLQLGGTEIEVLHTPGHTVGGVCFYVKADGILFSGDTLFAGSIGRTDFPGGSMSQEINSIRTRLLVLPPDTKVFPGHGSYTTIQHEMACNPYF